MNPLFSFILERGKSLVSKKLGAAVVAEGAAIGTPLQGVPLLVYIVVQGAVDIFKYYADKKFK